MAASSHIRLVVAVAALTLACQPRIDTSLDAGASDAEVRARSRALVAAEGRRDIDGAMPFYDQDAVLHVEGSPPARGHAAIRQLYQQFFQMPMTSFDATISGVEVARSGEMAFETGVNHFTFDRGGQRATATGKYLAVWRRRGGGPWVLAAVAVTNDAPPQ